MKKKANDKAFGQSKLFTIRATAVTGLPSNETFQRTRVIDANGTELTLPMMVESFDNAWFYTWYPNDIRASRQELLNAAAGLACKPDQSTWNRAAFVTDPQVPPGELWFCVREKPILSTKIINLSTGLDPAALLPLF